MDILISGIVFVVGLVIGAYASDQIKSVVEFIKSKLKKKSD